MNVDTPIARTFLLNLSKPNRSNFAGAGDVCAATGLQIDLGVPLPDPYKTDATRTSWWLDGHSLYETRIGVELLLSDPVFTYF